MLFCVLDDPRFPCPRTHMFHVRKLGEGFVQRGFHYRELKRASEVLHLAPCDVLYVSNHFTGDPVHRRFAGWLSRSLFRLLTRCQARTILWNFHTLPDLDVLRAARLHTIHLGEDLSAEAVVDEPPLKRFRDEFSVLSLRYSAPLHPSYATFERVDRSWDFNFIGAGYQRSLTSHCAKKYRALIVNTPPPVSEPLRVNSFRRAEVNLVFHSEANIRKGVIVERFAEALSLGGIIFHDHPRIAREFASLPSAILVRTPEDIDREFQRIRRLAPSERDGLRSQSLAAWKSSGLSYFDQAGRILAALPPAARS